MRRGDAGKVLDPIRALWEVGAAGGLTDGELLDRFAAGSAELAEPAFAALVERHGPMVLGACRRLLADDHLAEDAFQATFLVLARRAGSIREHEALGGWLHRVAQRVARRAKVRADRQRRRERADAREVAVVPPDRAERAEVCAAVDAEVNRLADAQRLPIVLCDLEGLTHEEAAHQLHWPVGTVKSRLARARDRLRARLARRGLAAPTIPLAAASVPPRLVALAARGALRFASGGSLAGAATSTASFLAHQELLAMTLARWMIPPTLAAAGLLAASGVALFGKSPDPAPATPEPPVARAVAPGPIPAPPGLTLEATGRVVDAAGRPVAGATVVIREWTSWRAVIFNQDDADRLRRTETMPDILAEAQTDADGRFGFADVATKPFPGEQNETVGRTAFPFDLVVLADGHGIAHEHLTAVNQHRPLTLALPAERPVRGRAVEPGGQPIAGARVRVTGVRRIGVADQDGRENEGTLNLQWTSLPLDATTDADGRFALRHLPPEARVDLLIRAAGHAQGYFPYATTDKPPADLADASIRTGEPTVELKPTDHRLVGRIVFEDGGRPAAGVMVFRGWDRIGRTDAAGQFTIDELPDGPFDLHVSAEGTDAVPLAMRVEMPDEPKVVDRTFELPQGATLAGRVADSATGRGVPGVKLDFYHRTETGEVRSFFGLQETTDRDGRYRFVVPAGRGQLEIKEVPPGYPPPPTRNIGEPAATNFARDIEAARGETAAADFAIPHGQGVIFRAVGPNGRPVAGAEVCRMSPFEYDKIAGRTDDTGRFELAGLDPTKPQTADITHPDRDLGARVVVPSPAPAAIEVRLAPLGSVSSRVLDAAGKPLAGATVLLYTDVEFPERLGLPVGNTLADAAGQVRLGGLIAGVEYYFEVKAAGHANATSERFAVRVGRDATVAEFRLPDTTQTLDGLVVDPRGVRLPNITVSVLEDPLSRYTPSGRRFQETDARGEFHLDGLPAGELTLLVYPKSDTADGAIRHMVRLKAKAGAKDVRLVLPDVTAGP